MKKYFGLIFFFLVTVSFGGDKEEKILKALQNKFETINDLTVDIIQKAGGKEILSGKLSFKKENKYNLDLKNILIISDGISIWNFNKKENKVIINNVDESDPSFFSFNTFVYDYPSQCIITSEQNGEVLILTPKENSDLNFSKA
ncbi:MAG TPA: outer membrane lipoprotein carrier protein LolA, partial [Ignavibacteriaceae bacterium]|nr:outer membrane lipoprotein carrier protein LolA [Ignavibacteriaceae bacterium]